MAEADYHLVPREEEPTHTNASRPLTLGAIVPMLTAYNGLLPLPIIRLFILSLSGLGISRDQMRESNNKFMSFSTLFLDVLHHKLDDNLQATVDFTCYVLNRFNCTVHHNKKYNLQQFASSRPYDIDPNVHHRLLIVETLYNMDREQRREKLTTMAAVVNLSTDRIDNVSEFVLRFCEQGKAPVGECVPGLGELDPNTRWTGKHPPDSTITIYFGVQPVQRKPNKKRVISTLGSISAVVSFSVLAILILWCYSFINPTHPLPRVTVPVNASYRGNQPYPVLLNSEGFIQNGSIRLTTTASSVNIYQMDCDDIVTINSTLTPPRQTEFTQRLNKGRSPINYHRDGPINLAPGSILRYNITSEYPTEHLPVPEETCLRLFLFDSQRESDRFDDLFSNLSFTSVDSTTCIPVGTLNETLINITTFYITKQGTYYVEIQYPKYLSLHATIDGYQVHYNISRATVVCEDFSPNNPCTVHTCDSLCFDGSSHKRTCLFAAFSDENSNGDITYEARSAKYLRSRAVTIFIGTGAGLLFVIGIIALVISSVYFCVMYLKPRPLEVWAQKL